MWVWICYLKLIEFSHNRVDSMMYTNLQGSYNHIGKGESKDDKIGVRVPLFLKGEGCKYGI